LITVLPGKIQYHQKKVTKLRSFAELRAFDGTFCTCANAFKIKLKKKICLSFYFVEILTNSKVCSERRIRMFFQLSFAVIGRFSVVYMYVHSRPAYGRIFRITGDFQNNFQSHKQLYEAGISFLEESYWKDFHNL
jgi:hypothetical protein